MCKLIQYTYIYICIGNYENWNRVAGYKNANTAKRPRVIKYIYYTHTFNEYLRVRVCTCSWEIISIRSLAFRVILILLYYYYFFTVTYFIITPNHNLLYTYIIYIYVCIIPKSVHIEKYNSDKWLIIRITRESYTWYRGLYKSIIIHVYTCLGT